MSLPQRKLNRLKGFDYSQSGAYFITICTHHRANTLSTIRRDSPCGCPQVVLSELGKTAERVLHSMSGNSSFSIERYVLMPNHIHFLLFLSGTPDSAGGLPTVAALVGSFKSKTALHWLRLCNSRNQAMGALWQRSYHDHILRNEAEYRMIAQYIDTNPATWENDCFYGQ